MILQRLACALLSAALLTGLACSDDDNPTGGGDIDTTNARSYYLGYTPFPYDVTSQAVQYSYSRIAAETDIVAHHFDDGIPWPEALRGEAFHSNIMNDWQHRVDAAPAGHAIYLALTPISINRDDLAPYKGESPDMALPSPWDSYGFDHDSVKVAYTSYCRRAIDFFSPEFVAIGIEVNLLAKSDTGNLMWADYVELHRHVYQQLKGEYPSLPIMVSFTGMDLIDGFTDADHAVQSQAFADVIGYTDYYGLSMHTVISAFMADSLPPRVLDSVFSLSGKPIAICETSYPAESFSVLGGSLQFNGSPTKQDQFFADLFTACDQYGCEFIINFVIRDYDALWLAMGSPDDINKLWRDTGFYDEDGNARPVLTRWLEALARTRI
ncbi:hypothetical protein GF420_06340 [candidate division GN15 bacterium]|nr:hypothetical protein [candidate division GN15 bacterium]